MVGPESTAHALAALEEVDWVGQQPKRSKVTGRELFALWRGSRNATEPDSTSAVNATNRTATALSPISLFVELNPKVLPKRTRENARQIAAGTNQLLSLCLLHNRWL